jgi:hypothetical protein
MGGFRAVVTVVVFRNSKTLRWPGRHGIPLIDGTGPHCVHLKADMPTGLSPKEAFELYENGKHRRYGLLFSVNGGAFAIAKLLVGQAEGHRAVLGALNLSELSAGMALFTIIMVADIFAFGQKMREDYLPDDFGWYGKAVLISIGILLFAGWLLVGFGKSLFCALERFGYSYLLVWPPHPS